MTVATARCVRERRASTARVICNAPGRGNGIWEVGHLERGQPGALEVDEAEGEEGGHRQEPVPVRRPAPRARLLLGRRGARPHRRAARRPTRAEFVVGRGRQTGHRMLLRCVAGRSVTRCGPIMLSTSLRSVLARLTPAHHEVVNA
jgi:hypothetical protein